MAKSKMKRKRAPKSILKIPDLEQSKSAVLNSLTSPSSQRTYDHAIREFIDWYPCFFLTKDGATSFTLKPILEANIGRSFSPSGKLRYRKPDLRRVLLEAAVKATW